jgi:hypothetical protein
MERVQVTALAATYPNERPSSGQSEQQQQISLAQQHRMTEVTSTLMLVAQISWMIKRPSICQVKISSLALTSHVDNLIRCSNQRDNPACGESGH